MVSSTTSSIIASTLLPAQVSNQISYAVLGKTLNAERQEGADLVSMIDGGSGGDGAGVQAGDRLVAKATGLGGILDTFA